MFSAIYFCFLVLNTKMLLYIQDRRLLRTTAILPPCLPVLGQLNIFLSAALLWPLCHLLSRRWARSREASHRGHVRGSKLVYVWTAHCQAHTWCVCDSHKLSALLTFMCYGSRICDISLDFWHKQKAINTFLPLRELKVSFPFPFTDMQILYKSK